jgi:phosphoglycerate transport regulatory protein PgtC
MIAFCCSGFRRRGPVVALALVLSIFYGTGVAAQEPGGPLVIVTSFPEPMYKRLKDAFEQRHPAVKVFIRSKKTSAAISFIEERAGEAVDLFWASAPDAFEVLKESGSLLRAFPKTQEGRAIGGFPLDDPDGFYRGFAISGYGLMWNRPYLLRRGLPEPTAWNDLTRPEYAGHIGITAPSRSGTTHLIVETILQAQGWEAGWATLSEIGGNLATVTARSFGVLDGVRSGRFGIGPVIDFFGLSARRLGAPVEFTYPKNTTFLPANIALVKRTANPAAARAFVDFLMSSTGQRLLIEPEISRLPVRRDVYAEAPADYPNPFARELTDKGIRFDSQLSRQRYHLVNALFDVLVTFRMQGLRRTWRAIHLAEAALSDDSPPRLREDVAMARRLAGGVPVTQAQAADLAVTSVFQRHKPGLPLSDRQIEMEAQWQSSFRQDQQEALGLATAALAALTSGAPE